MITSIRDCLRVSFPPQPFLQYQETALFWSPDSRDFAFVAENRLVRIRVTLLPEGQLSDCTFDVLTGALHNPDYVYSSSHILYNPMYGTSA